MAHIYSRLIIRTAFKFHIFFPAEFVRSNVKERKELYISLNMQQNLTESQINETTIKSDLRNRAQETETKGFGWIFNKFISLIIHFYKTNELRGGRSYDKKPLQSTPSLMNIENKDNKCFLWSILAHLHPAERNANMLTKYEPFLKELDTIGFDFSTPFICSGVNEFQKNNWSNNIICPRIYLPPVKSAFEALCELRSFWEYYGL